MVAIAQTAASSVLERSKPECSAYICSMVIGGRLGRREVSGTSLHRPFRTCINMSEAAHGAPLKVCQVCNAASQEFIVELDILPADSATKATSKCSGAGMRIYSGMWFLSQNWVNHRRPAPYTPRVLTSKEVFRISKERVRWE